MPKDYWYLVKATLAVCLIFYKVTFFETSTIFSDRTIMLIKEQLICKINNNSYHNNADINF